MSKFIVAVGSTRRPKLNAVWEALTILGPALEPNEQFEVIGEEAASGVSHTPLSRAEIMNGAKNRAEELASRGQRENKPWKFFVGLEGGLDVVMDRKSTRLNSSHPSISYAVFCLKKKK